MAKLNQVIQEMNQFEALKQMRTTGKRTDQLRPNGVPLETTLETEARRETLNPPKVVELLRRDMDDGATIVDVGAGTGLFTFAFSEALPAASIFALEVRTDALQTLNERKRNEGAKSANVTVMRMDEGVVPLLPQGQTADLVFICDVLDFVPAEKKDSFLSSLRSFTQRRRAACGHREPRPLGDSPGGHPGRGLPSKAHRTDRRRTPHHGLRG